MATGIFPSQTEEEFLSFEREYSGAPQHEDETHADSSEVDSDSNEELETDSATMTIVDSEAEKEEQRVCKFIAETCKCKLGPKLTPCSNLFSKESIIDQREKCFELEKFELDMAILGQLQAFSNTVKTDEAKKRHKYIEFLFTGRRVCRETFMFMHTISLKKYRNLLVHYSNNGLVSREHGNLHCKPHNRVPFNDIKAIVTFITRFAEIHGLRMLISTTRAVDAAALLLKEEKRTLSLSLSVASLTGEHHG